MDDILSLGIVPPYEVLASVRLDKRDIHNQAGQTALFAATVRGYGPATTLLLDAKADVNHADLVRLSVYYSVKECMTILELI